MTGPADYATAAEAVLGEPVEACGPATRVMGLSALALGQVSGAAGMAQRARGKRRSDGLPQAFLTAVTADRLHLLAQPKVRWNPRPKATEVLRTYDRATTRLEVVPNAMGAKVVVAPLGDDPFEIQVTRGAAGERLAEHLGSAG